MLLKMLVMSIVGGIIIFRENGAPEIEQDGKIVTNFYFASYNAIRYSTLNDFLFLVFIIILTSKDSILSCCCCCCYKKKDEGDSGVDSLHEKILDQV